MGFRSAISIPAVVLSEGRYAAAVDVPGSTRPSGTGLTGSDLQLWWTLPDHADRVDDQGVVEIKQTALNAVLGRLHPDRLVAALERLRGTDLLLERLVVPLISEHARPDTGRAPRALIVRFDRRLVDLVKSSARGGARIEVPVLAMRQLSSRWSAALYGRYLSWTREIYPPREIKFGRHPKGFAFELDAPSESLQDVFAFAGVMQPNEIKTFLVTNSERCPLRRELGRAGVAVDTNILEDEISPGRCWGLRIRISKIAAPGLEEIKASNRHAAIASSH